MAWCFSTRASVATVLTTHPSVSWCLRVRDMQHEFSCHVYQQAHKVSRRFLKPHISIRVSFQFKDHLSRYSHPHNKYGYQKIYHDIMGPHLSTLYRIKHKAQSLWEGKPDNYKETHILFTYLPTFLKHFLFNGCNVLSFYDSRNIIAMVESAWWLLMVWCQESVTTILM